MDATALAAALLQRWADAIAKRDLDALTVLFAPDAVFVATSPSPLSGQPQIRAYYAAAPKGLKVNATLVMATSQTDGMAIVADVVFDLPGGGVLTGRLSLACGQEQTITLYHLAVT